jgi:hypothetical protein
MKSTKIMLLAVFLLILIGVCPSAANAPVAQFTGNPTSGPAPLTVQFNDSSTGSPTGWAWYFGDENFTAPWTQVTSNAGWSPRKGLSSVVMHDGSIVLMGGWTGDTSFKDDTWRSTDKGATWSLMSESWVVSKKWAQQRCNARQ